MRNDVKKRLEWVKLHESTFDDGLVAKHAVSVAQRFVNGVLPRNLFFKFSAVISRSNADKI
jgi:hypothetical protein